MSAALEKLDRSQQDVVRGKVRDLLARSDAFTDLSSDRRRELAQGLVDVVAYFADPKLSEPVTATGLNTPKKTGADKVQDRLAKDQDTAQRGFKASAGREGADIYEDVANAVDFPEFVAGLIDGVFNSIVKASIQQMEAYGQLLAQVVKSVNEFAQDNFTLNQGRDWLVGRFPSSLQISSGSGQPRVIPTEHGEETELAEVRTGMKLESGIDLDDEGAETQLAQMAQLEMARLRQKQLATMVLMGINRIIVTDGQINAKVMIDVRTSDRSTKTDTASMHDKKTKNRVHGHSGDWLSSNYDRTHETHKTLVSSAVDNTSESKADMKAKLSGEVKVNFKSETYPLDKLASQTELESVNERAGQ